MIQANGTVLSTYSHTTTSVPIPACLSAALHLTSTTPITAYTSQDPHHVAHAASGVKTIDVPRCLTTDEAAGMYEIWRRKGWARQSGDEGFMSAMVASRGNPRELTRSWRYNFSPLLA